MKLDKRKLKVIVPVIAVAVILFVGVICLLAMKAGERAVYESVDKAVADYISELTDSDYIQSDVQQMGDQFFVTVWTSPSKTVGGEEFNYLFVLERRDGAMVISAMATEITPQSAGVNVRKVTCGGNTVVFGTVTDHVWLDLSQPVEPVDFTGIKISYSSGKTAETSVSNFRPFMLCIEGEVHIDEVSFMSGKDVVAELSKLPLTDDVMRQLNSCKSLTVDLGSEFGFSQD